MNYFISQEWSSTKGNHAGMSHLCRLIHKEYKNETVHICVPIMKNLRGIKYIYTLIYFFITIYLCFKVKKKDSVFLMEYLMPLTRQYIVAYILKHLIHCRIIGLAHLVPSDIEKYYTNDQLYKWTKQINTLLTLGSSLTSFFQQKNLPCNIVTSFHYVDFEYYNPTPKIKKSNHIKAIIMGNMKRNINNLHDIIKNTPNIDYLLCKGTSKESYNKLKQYPNITIYGYLSEEELKGLMNESDISLNLMYDTVGSNVITTSLAMGLTIIVNDVGSIRDYCNSSNAIFCKSTIDFINALNTITPQKIDENRCHAIQAAYKLNYKRFYQNLLTIN